MSDQANPARMRRPLYLLTALSQILPAEVRRASLRTPSRRYRTRLREAEAERDTLLSILEA
jgi:hypothetical protein